MKALKLSIPQIHSLGIRKATILAMAGQRAGKTTGIGIRTANYVRYFPKLIGLIAANTYLQLTQSTMVEVRRIWKNLFDITEYDKAGNPNGVYVVGRKPPLHFTKYHEFDDYRGIVSFRNGAVIFTVSLDNYLAHEGKTIAWAELDETKDTKEAAVKQVILARLSQVGLYYKPDDTLIYTEQPTPELTPINPCYINTSPAEGTVPWLEEMFDLSSQEEDILKIITDPKRYYYKEWGNKAVLIWSTYWNHANLPSNYIQKRKDELTEGEQLKFIYGYPFSKTGGEYFNEFNRMHHVRKVPFLEGEPIHLTYDFNLYPYMTLLGCQIEITDTEMNFRFYKQYCKRPPDNSTEAVTLDFVNDHIGMITDLYYYGDAMGTRGIEGFGSSVTRFDDVRNVLEHFLDEDSSDRTTRVNPGVLKRRKLLNKIFAGKMYIGHLKVNIFIDPECDELIRDCQYLKLGEQGKKKEKVKDEELGVMYEKFGHTSDAMEYLVCWVLSDYL